VAVAPGPSLAHRLLSTAASARNPLRILAVVGWLALAGVAVLSVIVDLSPWDPFGPSLGWSVGVLLVAVVTGFLLLRGRAGR